MKYILLSSEGNGVGKTYSSDLIAKELRSNGKKVLVASFADSIRTQLESVFKSLHADINPFIHKDLYNQVKNKEYNYKSEYNNVKLRDLICDYSDVIQKHFGDKVWGLQLYYNYKNFDVDYLIVDDFRRLSEFSGLASKVDSKDIFTIFLKKEDYKYESFNSSSDNYERQLDSSSFDLELSYKNDYSNTNEIIDTIVSYVLNN